MVTINHTALLLQATELPICFSSRSRSTHITRYNNRWIILSDGSGEGVNANPASIFGVACDHFYGRRVLVRLMVVEFGTFRGVVLETTMFTTTVHSLITELPIVSISYCL